MTFPLRLSYLLRTAVCACAWLALGAQAAGVPVRLIAFNDFHGHLEAGNNTLALADPADPAHPLRVSTGGAAALGGLIASLRAQMPNTVVFSSGDMVGAAPLVSTLFRHESTVEVMNTIGLDFGIVGNHEFDGGVDELRRLVKGGCARNDPALPMTSCAHGSYAGARFPLLAANVEDADGRPIFAPTLVKEFGGIKIGFIGVVTRTTPSIVRPSGIASLHFRDEAGTLNRYAAELKQQGVEAIVAVVHEGGEIDADWNDTGCKGAQGEIFKIADKLTRDIDLVFSAHTHQGYNCIVDTPHQQGLRVIQATSYGRGLAVIDIVLDPATRDIDRSKTASRNLPVVAETKGAYAAAPTDARVAKLVGEYVALAAPKADRAVGSITTRIDRGPSENAVGRGDFASGRLVADAQLAATRAPAAGGAQLALMNPGGIRAALPCDGAPPCTVTYGAAFTMQPFGNSLVVMTLTGAQLKALLEDQHKPKAVRANFLQPSRGLSYTWKRAAAYGERVVDLKIDGTPVRAEARYRVTVNSFLAEGGDGFKRLVDGAERLGGPLDVDALVEYLNAHPAYAPADDTRITITD